MRTEPPKVPIKMQVCEKHGYWPTLLERCPVCGIKMTQQVIPPEAYR